MGDGDAEEGEREKEEEENQDVEEEAEEDAEWWNEEERGEQDQDDEEEGGGSGGGAQWEGVRESVSGGRWPSVACGKMRAPCAVAHVSPCAMHVHAKQLAELLHTHSALRTPPMVKRTPVPLPSSDESEPPGDELSLHNVSGSESVATRATPTKAYVAGTASRQKPPMSRRRGRGRGNGVLAAPTQLVPRVQASSPQRGKRYNVCDLCGVTSKDRHVCFNRIVRVVVVAVVVVIVASVAVVVEVVAVVAVAVVGGWVRGWLGGCVGVPQDRDVETVKEDTPQPQLATVPQDARVKTKRSKGLLRCTKCKNYCEAHLPGAPFGQLLEEKMAEAGSASGLEAALSEFVSAATSGAAMQVVDEELLEVTVEHKYTVLTYKQVVEVFNRAPKALRLRSVNAKLFGKLHRGEKVLYPFRKKREYPTLRLVTRVGVRKETTKRVAAPEHFQRHGRLLLDAATDELMSNTKTMTLMRLPTVEGVLRKIRREEGLEVGPDDDGGDDADSNDSRSHAESAAPSDSARHELDQACVTPTKSSVAPSARAASNTPHARGSKPKPKGTSVVSARADDSEDVNDGLKTWLPESVTAPQGSVDFWIQWMPPEEAMLGNNLGKARFQLESLLQKPTSLVPGSDKRRATAHLELIDACKNLRPGMCESTDNDTFLKTVKAVQLSKRALPSSVQLTIIRRAVGIDNIAYVKAMSTSARQKIARAILAKLLPWRDESPRVFNPFDPKLPEAKISKMEYLKFFVDEVFTSRLAEWVSMNEEGDDLVVDFVTAAMQLWDVPETAQMSDEMANAWDEAARVANALTLLATVAITTSTPVTEYAAVSDMESAAAVTMAVPGPLQVMGLAVKASPLWSQRLANIKGKIDDLAEHAPKLHAKLTWVEAGVSLTADSITTLTEHIHAVPVFHAVMYEGAPDVLEAKIKQVCTLLADEGDALAAQSKAGNPEATDLLFLLWEMLAAAMKTLHRDDLLAAACKKLTATMAVIDSQQKLSAVNDAVCAYKSGALELEAMVSTIVAVGRIGIVDDEVNANAKATFIKLIDELVESDFSRQPLLDAARAVADVCGASFGEATKRDLAISESCMVAHVSINALDTCVVDGAFVGDARSFEVSAETLQKVIATLKMVSTTRAALCEKLTDAALMLLVHADESLKARTKTFRDHLFQKAARSASFLVGGIDGNAAVAHYRECSVGVDDVLAIEDDLTDFSDLNVSEWLKVLHDIHKAP